MTREQGNIEQTIREIMDDMKPVLKQIPSMILEIQRESKKEQKAINDAKSRQKKV